MPDPNPRLKDDSERMLRALSSLAGEIGILRDESMLPDPTPEQLSAAARRADECVTSVYQFAHSVRRVRDTARSLYSRAAGVE